MTEDYIERRNRRSALGRRLAREDNPELYDRVQSFKAWMIGERGLHVVTASLRARIVRSWLRAWGTLEPTKEQCQRTKEGLLIDGYAKGSVANFVRSFKDYGRYLGRDLALKALPAESARFPRFMSVEQIHNLIQGIDSMRDRALFMVLAYTGVRCQEATFITVEDTDIEKRRIMVQDGKGGHSADVPMSQECAKVVGDYLRLRRPGMKWLFPCEDGRQMSTNRVRVLARRYGKKAGIPWAVTPHQFRHSLATNLLAAGCPLPFVQRQLRHRRLETTLRYLHLSDDAQAANYDKFVPQY